MNKIKENFLRKKIDKTSDLILKRFEELDVLDDEAIKLKSLKLKNKARCDQYKDKFDKFIDDYLIESFSLCMVAVKRVTGLIMYKVQIEAAIGLVNGFIVEQKTGEGKTITGVLPAYLYGLSDMNCHIVTVNPYLTKRDGESNGEILNFLGLSVGIVLDDMTVFKKKEEYSKDVCYVSNTELGFDYLRDQTTLNKNHLMLTSFDFCLIDEVDSILIDDAKTPLIISAPSDDDTKALFTMATLAVNSLTKGYESSKYSAAREYLGEERLEFGDYYVDLKDKTVTLTDSGIKNLEEYLHIDNISDPKYLRLLHAVNQALYAKEILKKDRDYLVKNDSIQIIDEFTGRIMDGRTFSDGLHQAIEAKEKVSITDINDTIASITYQNFFRKYKVLSGMTGTAKSEEKEFKETYGIDVLVIRTNKDMIREDKKDVLYLRRDDKYRGVIEDIRYFHEKGNPILAATASLSESEYLSSLLKKEGLKYTVLNAKQDENEANIIARAGEFGAITVATNMAGRGTDIKLSKESKDVGGLIVIGTEKHESKRIDDQLRGRSGRQGDPGMSIFYLSTEDRVMRDYGSDILTKNLSGSYFDKGEPILNKSLLKAIKKSQDRVSLDNFRRRKETLYYDDVDNILRERLLEFRRNILTKDDLNFSLIYSNALKKCLDEELSIEGKALNYVNTFIKESGLDKKEVLDDFSTKVSLNPNYDHLRYIILSCVDFNIKEMMKAFDYLKNSMRYVSFGGIDSKSLYNEKAYEIFNRVCLNLNRNIVISYFDNFEV